MAMRGADPLQSWNSTMRGSNGSGLPPSESSMMLENPLSFAQMQQYKNQYSQSMDMRGSFSSQIPSAAGTSKGGDASTGKPTYVLNLHFLGLSGLPKAGWFERAPAYEMIVHAGGVAKRIRPRIPAPPPGAGAETIELDEFVPAEQLKVLERLDDRASIRCPTPGEYFRVDVWEERTPLLDLVGKGTVRSLLGQCYVPLEQKYNRRPCTWPIVSRTDKVTTEVGFLTCKFGLATMPGPVLNLRVVEGTIGTTEMQLAWETPENDGGTVLRGYRVEARVPGTRPGDMSNPLAGLGPIGDETPRTASAPAVAEPSVVLKNLTGNMEYVFCVWAVSEAGPGTGNEVYGKTGAVAPGLCGLPYLAEGDEGFVIQWDAPEDGGGADVIAYRVWLRALFTNRIGEVWPAEGWVDLGLFEHWGDRSTSQQTPLRMDALPECSGCLCSVSALNAAGLVGPSTQEVPIVNPQSSDALRVPRAAAREVQQQQQQRQQGEGDPLAAYQSPGALSRNQLSGEARYASFGSQSRLSSADAQRGQAQRAPLRKASFSDREVVDLDQDVGPKVLTRPRNIKAAASQALSTVMHPMSSAQSQQRPQARARSAGATSTGSAPSGVVVATQAVGRVVEASEIRREAVPYGAPRRLSSVPSMREDGGYGAPVPRQLSSGPSMREDGSSQMQALRPVASFNNPTLLRQPGISEAYAAGVARPVPRQQSNNLDGSVAGSWGLGQKGSLAAGRPSFEIR